MPTIMRTLLALGAVVLTAVPLESQRRSDVITVEELGRVQGKGGTAYDAVQMLRPRWLKSREVVLTGRPDDPFGSADAHVYLHDVDQGDVDYLKTIPVERIAELRYLSANQAASRYGPTNGPGIVVTLKQ